MRCIRYISASFLRRRQPQTWAAKRLQRWFRHRRLGGRSSFNPNMKDFEIRGLVDFHGRITEVSGSDILFHFDVCCRKGIRKTQHLGWAEFRWTSSMPPPSRRSHNVTSNAEFQISEIWSANLEGFVETPISGNSSVPGSRWSLPGSYEYAKTLNKTKSHWDVRSQKAQGWILAAPGLKTVVGAQTVWIQLIQPSCKLYR